MVDARRALPAAKEVEASKDIAEIPLAVAHAAGWKCTTGMPAFPAASVADSDVIDPSAMTTRTAGQVVTRT